MVDAHTYKPSLRLVVDNLKVEQTRPSDHRKLAAKQLSLPLGDEPKVTLIHQSQLNREIFFTIISFHKPKWVFDARMSPRLDTVAGSRKFAFDLFEQFHVNYLALLDTQLFSCADKNGWTGAISNHIKSSGDFKNNSVIIIDDTYDYDFVRETLEGDFNAFLPKDHKIDFIQYTA